MKPATMAAALTASAQLIESLRLERDAAHAECAELRERLESLSKVLKAADEIVRTTRELVAAEIEAQVPDGARPLCRFLEGAPCTCDEAAKMAARIARGDS